MPAGEEIAGDIAPESIDGTDLHDVGIECLARNSLVAQFVPVGVDRVERDAEETSHLCRVVDTKAGECEHTEFRGQEIASGSLNLLVRQEETVDILDESRIDCEE